MNSSNITFTYGSNNCTIATPQYGYSTDISMAFSVTRAQDGTYTSWDNGSSYDNRIFKMGKWLLNSTDMSSLSSFIDSVNDARGNDITLNLGSTPSGFFPFGPDLGDKGSFTIRILSESQSGSLYEPWLYFSDELSFLLEASPAYTIPTSKSMGTLQIGTVSNLPCPQTEINVNKRLAITTQINNASQAFAIDLGTAGDQYEANFDLECNQSLAGALLQYITGTGRGNDISVVTPSNYYMFGIDKGSSATYTTRLITNVITVEHRIFDRFKIPLKLWRRM